MSGNGIIPSHVRVAMNTTVIIVPTPTVFLVNIAPNTRGNKNNKLKGNQFHLRVVQ